MSDQISYTQPVSDASVEDRSEFIWKVYSHVVGGIIAFAGIAAYLFSTGQMEGLAYMVLNNWWLVFGAFILVSWGASHVAHRLESTAAQYAAYAALVVVEAVIFAPFLYMAQGTGVLESAATVTLMGSVGLIAVAMITRKDFSFLRGLLMWGFMLAIVAIIGALIFGFHLGTWFSVAMIGFAGIAVLYDTSNIMHHYPKDRYVGAAMALFASIALMFWYVLRLFLSRE